MFGDFFSNLGKKLDEPGEDNSPASKVDAVNDLFGSLLSQPQTQSNNQASAAQSSEDPMQYFCSPERGTAKPHLTQQKPNLTECQPTEEPENTNMPRMSLFAE